ncbi:hypothetical protein ACYJW8_04135 [Frateuria aurantia]
MPPITKTTRCTAAVGGELAARVDQILASKATPRTTIDRLTATQRLLGHPRRLGSTSGIRLRIVASRIPAGL